MTMKRIMLAGLVAIALSGCKEHKTVYSEPRQEDAVVTEKYHQGMWIQPILCGKMITMITHPEINRITFSGAVNFEINDPGFYNRFSEQEKAVVLYREEYRETYDDLNKDGKKEFIGRELRNYIFLDAQPATNPIQTIERRLN